MMPAAMTSEPIKVVNSFAGRRVLVVGDFMLDRYVVGDAERVSPEAPAVPVLRVVEREDRVGGAGFVALNVVALGGDVACFGLVGNDAPGTWLKSELERAGAEVDGLLSIDHRPTTTKTRFVRRVEGRREHLLRVDEEDVSDLTPQQSERLLARFREQLASADAVTLQDYAKGVLTATTCGALIAAARAAGKPAIVDPARVGRWEKYAGATLLKPNRTELDAGLARPVSDSELDAACRSLIEGLRLEAILVTLGQRGARLVTRDRRGVDFPSAAREVVDPVGAGDAALAALSMAVAAGATMEPAAALANLAGGLEVAKAGCVPVPAGELRAELERGLA